MSDPNDDRLDDFREAQETDHQPDLAIYDPDDLPAVDDEDDDELVPDDDRVVPLEPEDPDAGI